MKNQFIEDDLTKINKADDLRISPFGEDAVPCGTSTCIVLFLLMFQILRGYGFAFDGITLLPLIHEAAKISLNMKGGSG
jgi:hypothetical protein